jgi:signal transduction histidine kinase
LSVRELIGRVDALAHLPIRPATARQTMNLLPDPAAESSPAAVDWSRIQPVWELDPGWVLAEATTPTPLDPTRLVAEREWWPVVSLSTPLAEALQHLWRHTVAVSVAARWLAREAEDPAPESLVRAGLLHGLGRWAVAAVAPEWIGRWLDEKRPAARRAMELSDLGTDLNDLGRRLAQRWGCEPIVVDTAWLHASPTDVLNHASEEPSRLAILQQAFRWAESTPWALWPSSTHDGMPADPRLRILIAEVQSRCGSLFVAADSTTHEERMTRQAARLALRLSKAEDALATQGRLLQALAESEPTEALETWTNRAARFWCAEPEVTAASIRWKEESASQAPAEDAKSPVVVEAPDRAPSVVLPLRFRGRELGEIQLRCGAELGRLTDRLSDVPVLSAWSAWAALLTDRSRLEERLRKIVSAVHVREDDREVHDRSARLEALAEFAAGAGHELNNPLAVIVGRAQLLLSRCDNQEVSRSLQIIIGQAQRTHRILRDLMFVSRPPQPRPRACRPAELLQNSMANVQEECDARGVRLQGDLESLDTSTWADPDALGHVADVLLRNAIQATPTGGKIQIRSSRQGNSFRWSIADGGKGITPGEGEHLFDPFYCGRQAGRGLGLGLPRAARIVSQVGGTLQWSSTLGQGSVFQVEIPLQNPPPEMAPKSAAGETAVPRLATASPRP